jgi:hypothetical protein
MPNAIERHENTAIDEHREDHLNYLAPETPRPLPSKEHGSYPTDTKHRSANLFSTGNGTQANLFTTHTQ